MRTFAIFLMIILLGAGGGYYYWNHYLTEPEDPLTYCPLYAEIVIETNSIQDLSAFINDSTTILHSTEPLRKLRTGLSRFLDPIRDRKIPAILAIESPMHHPRFTLIISKMVEDKVILQNKQSTASGNWFVVGTSSETTDTENTEFAKELRTAFDGVQDSIAVSMKATSIVSLFDSNLNDIWVDRLDQEFKSIEWLGFGMSNEDPFYTTSIATISGSVKSRNRSQDLIALAPFKTNAVLAIDDQTSAWALLHIPYENAPNRFEDNLFMLILNDSSDQNSSIDSNQSRGLAMAQKIWPNQPTVRIDLGRAAVLANSEDAANRFSLDFEAYNLLAKSEGFRQLNTYMSDASLTFFLRQISETDKPHALENIDENNTLNAILLQVNSELENTSYFSLSALYGESNGEQLPMIWTSTFDADVTGGPWQFENHYTQETEFIVQDRSSQLYLVDANGRVLWKKSLKDQIIGSVKMIDAFNSNKWQILFATENRLHLVDRNGNDVEGFPKRFQTGTKSMPLPVRYEPNGELRILVADGSVMKNYSADGKTVKGWSNPNFDDGDITHIDYMRFGTKDYLLALTDGKQLHILDRSGEKREATVMLDSAAQSSFIAKGDALKSCRIISHDSVGNIIMKRFDGDQSIRNLIPTGSNLVFAYNDIHEVKYTIVSGNRLFGLNNEFDVAIDLLLPTSSIDTYQWVNKAEGIIAVANKSDGNGFLIDLNKGILSGIDGENDEHMLLLDLDNNGTNELIKHDGNGRIIAYRISI